MGTAHQVFPCRPPVVFTPSQFGQCRWQTHTVTLARISTVRYTSATWSPSRVLRRVGSRGAPPLAWALPPTVGSLEWGDRHCHCPCTSMYRYSVHRDRGSPQGWTHHSDRRGLCCGVRPPPLAWERLLLVGRLPAKSRPCSRELMECIGSSLKTANAFGEINSDLARVRRFSVTHLHGIH